MSKLATLAGFCEDRLNEALRTLTAYDAEVNWDAETDTFILTARLKGAVIGKETEDTERA